MTAETIAKALGGRKAGNGWIARYPAHDDRMPSLSIRDPDEGTVLVRCQAGSQPDADDDTSAAETTGEAYVVVGIGYLAEIVGDIAGPTVELDSTDGCRASCKMARLDGVGTPRIGCHRTAPAQVAADHGPLKIMRPGWTCGMAVHVS
jgi:hypothetical protein